MEVIDLVNDGSGLGFGIIGGRSTGVVVKTILPGGVADRVSCCFSSQARAVCGCGRALPNEQKIWCAGSSRVESLVDDFFCRHLKGEEAPLMHSVAPRL